MRRVVVVGGANLDLTVRVAFLPAPGETVLASAYDESPGGKAANQAVAAALWGTPTTLIAVVGTDPAGEVLLKAARAAGVDTTLVRRDQTGTGLGLVVIDPDGAYQTVVVPRGNARLIAADIASIAPLWADTAVLVIPFESPPAAVEAAARAASANGVRVIFNAAPATGIPESLWPHVDVLVVNEGEASHITGRFVDDAASASEALEVLLTRVRTAIITLGAGGALVGTRGAAPRHLAGLTVPVVSTLGAGDAFVGVLAAELAGNRPLADAAEAANRAAAASVMNIGAQAAFGDRLEVERRLASLAIKETMQ